MGAEPYWYFTRFQPNIDAALQDLRQNEFAAGRYNPVVPFLDFPPGPNSPAPGAQHDSIEEAMEDAAEDGTRSILDLDHVSEQPEFCAAARLEDELLEELYGTKRPTREMVERNLDLFENIERGHGVYTVLYKNDQPDEILFAGYSFD